MFETILENDLWVEKYRPKELEDVVGNETHKKKFQEYIIKKSIPHLLFIGKQGTGKTTIAKILCNKIAFNNYLYINGSDENNVETVRTKIKNFASSIGFGGLKIIQLDEFDYFSLNGQAALRSLMETFSKNTRFILTCNYPQKILAPIRSRCQEFEFKPMSEKSMIKYIVSILSNEKIDFEPTDVVEVIRTYKPDIRKIINTLQLMVNDNNKIEFDKKKILDLDINEKILNLIIEKNSFNKIRKIIADNNISKFIDLYQYLYKNIEKVIKDKDILLDCYIKIAEYLYRDSIIADGEINFMSFIAEIIK